jgi:hypothetical protein
LVGFPPHHHPQPQPQPQISILDLFNSGVGVLNKLIN